MKIITRAAIGSLLQTNLLTGRPFQKIDNTTLNEKFGIQKDNVPPAGTMPFLNYFTIGNGGHKFSVGSNGIGIPDPVQHRTRDMALYNHIPFVLREPANDLSPAQMANYRLRTLVTYNGITYVAYYAKVFDYTGVSAQMFLLTINDDGSSTMVPFVPDSSDLNPTPPDLSNTGVNVTTGQYVVVSEKLPLKLTPDDVKELLNVANIIYGDPAYAVISEIGICSGVDLRVTGGGTGQPTFTYLESIATQIVSYFNTFYSMQYADDGIDILLEIGATEPMLKLFNKTR